MRLSPFLTYGGMGDRDRAERLYEKMLDKAVRLYRAALAQQPEMPQALRGPPFGRDFVVDLWDAEDPDFRASHVCPETYRDHGSSTRQMNHLRH